MGRDEPTGFGSGDGFADAVGGGRISAVLWRVTDGMCSAVCACVRLVARRQET